MLGSTATTLFGSPIGLTLAVAVILIAGSIEIPSTAGRGRALTAPTLLAFVLVGDPSLLGAAVLGATAVASGWVRLLRSRKSSRHENMWRSPAAALVVLIGWAALARPVLGTTEESIGQPLLTAFVLGAVWITVDEILRRTPSRGRSRRLVARSYRALEAAVAMGAMSSAVVTAAFWLLAGPLPGIIVVVSYAITHRLFASYIRAIRIERVASIAIGLLPEAAGVVELGHSADVARIARAVGRMRHYRGTPLRDLEYGALLHGIGRLYTTQPDVRESGFSTGDLARWGAEILESSTRLSAAAAIVRSQADPHRIPGAGPDPDLDLRAQIVQIACAAETARSRGISLPDVIDLLYAESEYRLNPEVLADVESALRQVDSDSAASDAPGAQW